MNTDLNLFSSENLCFIIYPYCNTQMDYGKINANMHRGEEDVVPCLACKKLLRLISLDSALTVREDVTKKELSLILRQLLSNSQKGLYRVETLKKHLSFRLNHLSFLCYSF